MTSRGIDARLAKLKTGPQGPRGAPGIPLDGYDLILDLIFFEVADEDIDN
jgi:hypothetical protein